MKDYIVAFDVSKARSKPALKADFDSLLDAENYIVDHLRFEGWGKDEIIVCKRQSRNQWWSWDEGWEALKCGAVVVAKAVHALALEEAQKLVNESRKLEVDDSEEPTHDVNWTLRHSRARLLKLHAQVVLEQAEIRLLEVVLEAHGNVEWPIID